MEVTQSLYEDAKGFLMKTDENGNCIYDHLANLVSKLIDGKPSTVSNFEDFSRQVKSDQFRPKELNSNRFWHKNKPDERCVKRATEIEGLFKSHGKKSTKNQPAEAKASGNAPNAIELSTKPLAADLISHMQYFEMAGVSLPKTETYQLVLAIQQLAQEKNLKNARFWGKISGTQSNYYVVESEHVGKHHQSQLQQTKESLPILNPFAANNLTLPPPSEDPEQGANQQSFWVSSYPGAKWNLLPDVTPHQIICSRQIRKFFTGNLEKDLSHSYPSFPGTEANYLRAQIARITFATTISPLSFYKEPGEEEEPEDEDEEAKKLRLSRVKPDLVPNEEFAPIETKELQTLENWVHHKRNIMREGRCKRWVPPKKKKEGEEGEEEEAEEEPEEEEEGDEGEGEEGGEKKKKKEAVIPLLRSLAEDTVFDVIKPPAKPSSGNDEEGGEEGGEQAEEAKKIPAWTIKFGNALFAEHAVALVKSRRWSGSVTFALEKGKVFGSIYIGNGIKNEPRPFTPLLPPVLQSEGENLKEMVDPPLSHELKMLKGEDPNVEEEAKEDGEEGEGEGETDE